MKKHRAIFQHREIEPAEFREDGGEVIQFASRHEDELVTRAFLSFQSTQRRFAHGPIVRERAVEIRRECAQMQRRRVLVHWAALGLAVSLRLSP